MALKGLGQAWRTLREVDLGQIKDEAEQRFELLLVGRPEASARWAERLSATPGRRGIHPWIRQVDPSAAEALQDSVASDGLPRLVVLIQESPSADERWREIRHRLSDAGLPVVTAVTAAGAERGVGAELPREGETRRALLPVGAGDAASVEALAPALLAATPEGRGLRLALARQLPVLRPAIVDDLIEDVSRANAGYAFSTGLGEAVPGLGLAFGLADVFVLTKNQLVMAYKIALAHGRQGSPRELMIEVTGVIGGGLLFRQIARGLVGLLPVIGLVPKVAVAYAGTRLIGTVVRAWAAGEGLMDVGDLRGMYREALAGGRRIAGELARRGGS